MNSNEALEKLLHSYERYYDISTENIALPFVAEAVFKSHNEQYFLVKEAKLSDIDSNEIVFFYRNSDISLNGIFSILQTAWERGLERVNPYYGHRNTDITLIILADKIEETVFNVCKKAKSYKSYKLGLYGWSAFRLLAYESSTGRAVTNRRGSDLKKVVANLYQEAMLPTVSL